MSFAPGSLAACPIPQGFSRSRDSSPQACGALQNRRQVITEFIPPSSNISQGDCWTARLRCLRRKLPFAESAGPPPLVAATQPDPAGTTGLRVPPPGGGAQGPALPWRVLCPAESAEHRWRCPEPPTGAAGSPEGRRWGCRAASSCSGAEAECGSWKRSGGSPCPWIINYFTLSRKNSFISSDGTPPIPLTRSICDI